MRIIIKTQKDLDNLPLKFDEFIKIEIWSNDVIHVRDSHKRDLSTIYAYESSTIYAYDSSKVIACDSSKVYAHESSAVTAYESSKVIAYDSSTVTAHDSSTIYTYDSSTVTARDSSTIYTYDSSTVTARDSSTIYARNSSKVYARNSSTITAYDSSKVYAYESSKVIAYDSSTIYAYNSSTVSAYGSSTIYARNSSTVSAYGSSTIYAYNSSTVTSYLMSVVFVYSESVSIKRLYDNSTLKFMCNYDISKIEDKHKTAQVVKQQKELSFETWLERGYVKADGILQKLIGKKKLKDIEVFTVENDFGEKSFVIKKGEISSHGKDLQQAKDDLKYKIGNRDTSQFKKWKLSDDKPIDELIQSYRIITGACEFGVKDFCEKQGKLKSKYKVSEIIEMTNGAFGNKEYKEFFK